MEVPLSIRTQKDVAAIVRVVAKENKRLKTAELRKMEADLRTRLRKEGAEYKKARRSVGLDVADRAEHETSKAEMAAANVLLDLPPDYARRPYRVPGLCRGISGRAFRRRRDARSVTHRDRFRQVTRLAGHECRAP